MNVVFHAAFPAFCSSRHFCKAAKPAGKQAPLPEDLPLAPEIDWHTRKATLSVGDEKPLKLVLDGDTWRPLSDAG